MINKCVYKWSLYRILCRHSNVFIFHEFHLDVDQWYCITNSTTMANTHKTLVNYTKSHHDEIAKAHKYLHALFLLLPMRYQRIQTLLPIDVCHSKWATISLSAKVNNTQHIITVQRQQFIAFHLYFHFIATKLFTIDRHTKLHRKDILWNKSFYFSFRVHNIRSIWMLVSVSFGYFVSH